MTSHPSLTGLVERPLNSERLMTRAVELCCPVPDRRSQCLTFIVCDDERRIRQPIAITDLPPGPDLAQVEHALFTLDCVLLDIGPTMLVIRGRPHDRVEDADRTLHQYLLDRYRTDPGEPARLLGFYVAGPTAVRRMPDPPPLVPA